MRIGYVYFIEEPTSKRIKIGFTSSRPDSRLAELQVGSPFRLRRRALIRGTIELEGSLHQRFRRAHLHGEWFQETPELTAYIAAHAEPWEIPLPEVRPTVADYRSLRSLMIVKGEDGEYKAVPYATNEEIEAATEAERIKTEAHIRRLLRQRNWLDAVKEDMRKSRLEVQ